MVHGMLHYPMRIWADIEQIENRYDIVGVLVFHSSHAVASFVQYPLKRPRWLDIGHIRYMLLQMLRDGTVAGTDIQKCFMFTPMYQCTCKLLIEEIGLISEYPHSIIMLQTDDFEQYEKDEFDAIERGVPFLEFNRFCIPAFLLEDFF